MNESKRMNEWLTLWVPCYSSGQGHYKKTFFTGNPRLGDILINRRLLKTNIKADVWSLATRNNTLGLNFPVIIPHILGREKNELSFLLFFGDL